ncbi:MAG TPA: lipoprotein insertase outer membrane protein LolB [Steroidobacteraceae bacterium]
MSRALSALRAFGLVVLLCTGCATLPHPRVTPVTWEQRLPALQAIAGFDLEGRVAASDGKQGFSAGLRWQQRNDSATLDLTAPLGIGAAHIEQTPEGLSVTTSKGVTLTQAAASDELAGTLGFEPPLRSLRYWVLGASDPSFPAQESIDDQQHLTHLEQDGWRVELADYAQVGQQWLPRRVTVTRQSLRLRLVVDTWRL